MKRMISLLDATRSFFGFDSAIVSLLKAEYEDVDDSVIDNCKRRARRLQIPHKDRNSFILKCIQKHVDDDKELAESSIERKSI